MNPYCVNRESTVVVLAKYIKTGRAMHKSIFLLSMQA